jgi:hypothetical protein
MSLMRRTQQFVRRGSALRHFRAEFRCCILNLSLSGLWCAMSHASLRLQRRAMISDACSFSGAGVAVTEHFLLLRFARTT